MPFDALDDHIYTLPQETVVTLPRETIIILQAVRKLLWKQHRWTKATMEAGSWWNRSYCVVGALVHVIRRNRYSRYFPDVRHHLNNVANQHGFATIEALNDHEETTHAQMMQVLYEAIIQADEHLASCAHGR